MADAPAAAAAPPPAAPKPTPTPSGKSPAPFDTRIALAKSLHRVLAPAADDGASAAGDAADDAGAEGATETDAAEGTAARGDGAAEDADGAEGEGEADEGEADEAGGDAEASTPEARLDAVTKAFASGDIEAMAKALEQPGVKVAGPVRRAFRAFQRRTQQLDARDQEQKDRDRNFEEAKGRAQQAIAEDSRRLSEAERNFTRKFGSSFAIEQAWENEDALALGKALEKACKGASLAEITQRLASGKAGKTPEERQLAEARRKLDEDRAALERKGQDAEAQKRQQQSREAAVGRIGEALKTHPYLQTKDEKTGAVVMDQEALAEVFGAYEASWNGEKFTKTARQCADELQEKLLARAKARGLAVVPAAAPAGGKAPAGKTPPAAPPRKPAPRGKEPPRSQKGSGAALDLNASRDARIAQARRMVEMQRRGVR